MNKEQENEFLETAISIRNGQENDEQVIEYMNINPEFKKWYEDRYLKKNKTTYGALQR